MSKLKVREAPIPPPRKGCLGLSKTQTEIQTPQVEVQTTPVPVQPQTTLVSIETQTVKVRKAQTAKTKDKM